MAKRRPYKWIQATGVKKGRHKGALHRALGISEDKDIPHAKLVKAAKAGGHLGHMARFALNVAHLRHHHGPLSKRSLAKRRRHTKHNRTR